MSNFGFNSGKNTTKSRIVAAIPGLYSRDHGWSIKGRSVAADRYTLVSPANMDINIGEKGYALSGRLSLDLSLAASWDYQPSDYTIPANRAHKNFFIFACQSVESAPVVLISANSTAPTGFTMDNSRKIGGFVCFGAAAGEYVIGDIVPESIWDLMARPSLENNGAVPNYLATRFDYDYIRGHFMVEQWKPAYQALLDSRYSWLATGVLTEGEAGVNDDTHRVVETTDEATGVTTRTQEEYAENPAAKIFQLGFTVASVEALLSA